MPCRREGHPGGKLKAAARRWAGGRAGAAVRSEDPLTAAAELPDREPASADAVLELPQDEADAVGLFFALDTQWRRCGLSGSRLGLDYSAIEPTARMLEIPVRPQLLTDLRTMEGAALEVLLKR